MFVDSVFGSSYSSALLELQRKPSRTPTFTCNQVSSVLRSSSCFTSESFNHSETAKRT